MSHTQRRGGYTHPKPSTHKGSGPWVPGYRPEREGTCGAMTVRDPEVSDWDPDVPATVVSAACVEPRSHQGWHMAADGYAWDADDDTRHTQFPGRAS